MIKVTRNGKLPYYYGQCQNCGCCIECEQKDGVMNFTTFCVAVLCPTKDCGAVITCSPYKDLTKPE